MNGFSGFDKVDLVAMMSSEFFSMDLECDRKRLYKYLHFQDKEFVYNFLRNPTIKFATKEQLNDPFDLTRRFDKFGGEIFQKFASNYIQRYIDEKLRSTDFLLNEFQKRPEFVQMKLTRGKARQVLQSPLGQAAIHAIKENISAQIPTYLEATFGQTDNSLDAMFADAISDTGVLSLSDQPDNRALDVAPCA